MNTGHIIKYKVDLGNGEYIWVPIPVAMSNMYETYVAYCHEHSITAVDETTYYQTLGNLQALVDQLTGSQENINALVAALNEGALPLSMGGTGLTLTIPLEQYLKNAEEDGGLSLCTHEDAGNIASDIVDSATRDMLTGAMFSSGTTEPNAGTPGKFYFQYK